MQPRRSSRLAQGLHKELSGMELLGIRGRQTEPDKTEPNKTKPDKTGPAKADAVLRSDPSRRLSTPFRYVHHPSIYNPAAWFDRPDSPNSDSLDNDADMQGGVRNRNYRRLCLFDNHIYIRHPANPLPSTVAMSVEQMVCAEPNTCALLPDQVASAIYELDDLGLDCCESQVTSCLSNCIFPLPKKIAVYGPATGLCATTGVPMARHLVPPQQLAASFPVSRPRPDLLYGYPHDSISSTELKWLFTETQRIALSHLHPQLPLYADAGDGLLFPFFAIEFKAATGTGGNLWIATNQCAGASAACLQAVDRLNAVLGEHGCEERVPNLCYSIAVDNNLAQLHVAWKDDAGFYVKRLDNFLLSIPEHLVSLRRRVLNILEWGRNGNPGGRLSNIRVALDIIMGVSQRVASEAAKSQPGPEDDPPDGLPDSKRRRKGV